MVELITEREQNFFWKYRIPVNIECQLKRADSCPICTGDERFANWLSRFLISDVPTDVLQKFIDDNFNMYIDDSILIEHRKHIIVHYLTDAEVREKAVEDFTTIMSDLDSGSIDEKKAMDTSIRMLYAKILQMQKAGDTSKEFLMSMHELKSFIEMKLKMKRELPEESTKINLAEIIKIDLNESNGDAAKDITIERTNRK